MQYNCKHSCVAAELQLCCTCAQPVSGALFYVSTTDILYLYYTIGLPSKKRSKRPLTEHSDAADDVEYSDELASICPTLIDDAWRWYHGCRPDGGDDA